MRHSDPLLTAKPNHRLRQNIQIQQLDLSVADLTNVHSRPVEKIAGTFIDGDFREVANLLFQFVQMGYTQK
jgi:hypothetical protein